MLRRALFILAILLTTFSVVDAQNILVEAERFQDLGGWVIDQQSMDQMGSAYLLAHGLGQPVKDASTTITFPAGGKYRVWVRTRDWAATWNNPEPAQKARMNQPKCMTCHRVDATDQDGLARFYVPPYHQGAFLVGWKGPKTQTPWQNLIYQTTGPQDANSIFTFHLSEDVRKHLLK